MKKKFLRKSLNICISCSGRGSHLIEGLCKHVSKKNKYLTRLCTDCYGTGIADPKNKPNVTYI